MKHLSFWARSHPRTARLIIVLGHVVLTNLAIYLGWALELKMDGNILYLLAFLFLVTCIVYPSRKRRKQLRPSLAYSWQKSCDLLLMVLTFVMIAVFAGNERTILTAGSELYAANTPAAREGKPTAAEILASLSHRDKNSLSRMEKRILKKEFRKQLRVYGAAVLAGDKQRAENAGLMILAIIAAVGLWFLLLALVCSISCSGAEGLAVIVFILGTAAIVVGTIFAIRAINKGPRRSPDRSPNRSPTTALN